MKVLQCKNNLSRVDSSKVHCEATVVGKCHPHVTARCIVHNQIQSALTLECKVESDDELVVGKREDVSLSAGISDQILRQDLVFLEDLHRVELPRLFAFFTDQVDGAKTALSQWFNHFE